MSESETDEKVTAHFYEGTLELRSKGSPDAWIITHDPATVEQ